MARAPKYTRYAAPSHLAAKKNRYEEPSNAPMPVADRAKYTEFATRMARIAGIPWRAPRRSALDRTNNTAGPGVKDRIVSVAAKSHQVVEVTTRYRHGRRCGCGVLPIHRLR